MKTLKEKHKELSDLITEPVTLKKLHGFYDRQLLRAKKIKATSNPNLKQQAEEIILHLNHLTGYDYKSTNPDTKAHIKARLEEGFTLEDFKNVNKIKVKEWLEDSYWRKFLRPSTLYCSKNFENYKQQYIAEKRDEERKKRQQEQKKLNQRNKIKIEEQKMTTPEQAAKAHGIIQNVLQNLASKKRIE